jgi:hypothetical protein
MNKNPLRFLLPAALAGVFLVGSAPVRSQEKYVEIHGQGGRSCGSFIKSKQPHTLQDSIHYQDMGWVQGFLFGIDTWNPYTVRHYDYNGLDLWLEEYCKKHPIQILANAALAFYREEIGGRAPTTSDPAVWQPVPPPEAP